MTNFDECYDRFHEAQFARNENINRLKFLLSLVLILIISCSKVDNSVKESFDKAEPISTAIMSSMVNIKEALSQKNIDSNYVKLEMGEILKEV